MPRFMEPAKPQVFVPYRCQAQDGFELEEQEEMDAAIPLSEIDCSLPLAELYDQVGH